MSPARWMFLASWLFALPVLAQDGGQGSPLSGSQGVRALGAGGAVSTWLDEPSAIWWNPATLLLTPVRRLELQHTENAFDTRTEHFAFATPTLDHGAWAVAGALQTTSDIIITGPTSPTPLGTEDFNRFQLGAGYAFGLPKSIDAGLNLTVAGYKFMGQQRVAWGLDLGLSPFSTGALNTAIVVKNFLRPTFSFANGAEDRWARQLIVGAGVLKSGLAVGLEAEFSERQDSRFRAGAEYQVATPLALRAGYDGFGPTAGASVRYKSFRIDYAFVSPSDLGTEHRFGLTIDIGRPIEEQRRLRDQQISYEVAAALEKQKLGQQDTLEAQAQHAVAAGAWGDAAVAYAQLTYLFPEEPAYSRGLEEVTRRRDSALAAELDLATQQATSAERLQLLDSLAAHQMALGQWSAATVTTERLAMESGPSVRADSLHQAATDSLAARTASLVAEAQSALADSGAAEAAGWARAALFYDSASTEANRLLQEAERLAARQELERDMFSSAVAADSVRVVRLADSLLSEYPDHALAQDYAHRFAPGAKAVPIETVQADAEAWEWYTRAFGAFREGRFEEAIEWWQKVEARYPTSEDTRKNLEQARLRLDSEGAGKPR